MPTYLGIDAGGSSTRCLVADDHGVVFGGEGPGANLAVQAPTQVREALVTATAGAPAPDVVCGCFAGLVTERQGAIARSILSDLFPRARVEVRPDFHAALAACLPGTTACVIAGTGSVVASWMRGTIVKTGGGGPLLGDQGSAFAIGRRGLRIILLGRPPGPALETALREQFSTTLPDEVVSNVLSLPSPASAVASFAPIIAEDALGGHSDSEWAIAHEMGLLAEVVGSHLSRFHAEIDEPRLGLAGGLWSASEVFQKEFEHAMQTEAGPSPHDEGRPRKCIIERLREPPVSGALELARRLHDEYRSP